MCQRALTKELNLKPLKKIKSQNLTAANMKNRFLISKALLRRFTIPKSNNILFSDEKIFTIKERYSAQNNRVNRINTDDITKEKLEF